MSLKTITQICVEADEHRGDRMVLYSLLAYVKENGYYYKICERFFMYEHITNYISELDNRIITFD